MGRTATCAVEIAKTNAKARRHEAVPVLLETDEIVLRAEPRSAIPRADVRDPKVDGDALVFEASGARYRLALGEKEAAKWAHDLVHPKTLFDKLGVPEGASVAAIGMEDAFAPGFLVELAARTGAAVATKLARDHAVVFVGARTRDVIPMLPKITKSLSPAGALWIVRPKGKGAPPDAPKESEIRDACRALDLVDVKVAKFSDTLTADKYARRRAK